MNSNQKIKSLAKKNGIKLWQIADRLGLQDSNFSKKLRKSLSKDEEEMIIKIITELRGGMLDEYSK